MESEVSRMNWPFWYNASCQIVQAIQPEMNQYEGGKHHLHNICCSQTLKVLAYWSSVCLSVGTKAAAVNNSLLCLKVIVHDVCCWDRLGWGVVNKWTDTDNCHYYLITINVLYCRRLDKCLISTPCQLPPQVISKQMWTKTKHCYSKLLTPPPPPPPPPPPIFPPLLSFLL